jgi:SAM-dependent methyltransferase
MGACMKSLQLYLLGAVFSVLSLHCHDFEHMLWRVFTQQEQEIASFIDSVLRQLPSKQILDEVKKVKTNSHHALYNTITELQQKQSLITKLKRKFQLLQVQKQLLSQQIHQLLSGINCIGNYLEIGTPGTYGSTIRNKITGTFTVITEKQQPVYDRIASYTSLTQHGYDQYIPLFDYQGLSATIETNSIDLIVCVIGLHHMVQEKIVPFIQSIHRVLRPGGILILREHDAHSPELIDLCHAAHSVFNAIISQESVVSDTQEIRNFQPLSYWISYFEENGFSVAQEQLLQEGDTTKNTLIKIVKNCVTEEDDKMNAEFHAKQQPHYLRDASQSYLTAPEWYNVDSAQEYATFIHHTPFFQFPYFKSIKNYWTIFSATFKEVSKKQGLVKTLFSSYTLMNLFVGTFMTLEFTTKAIISFPVRKMYEGQEAETIQLLVQDHKNEIGTILPEAIIKNRYAHHILLIELPRYKLFTHCMLQIAQSNISVLAIAGNKEVMCKISHKECDQIILDHRFCNIVSWRAATNQSLIFTEHRVPVLQLSHFINTVTEQNGSILYVHDF